MDYSLEAHKVFSHFSVELYFKTEAENFQAFFYATLIKRCFKLNIAENFMLRAKILRFVKVRSEFRSLNIMKKIPARYHHLTNFAFNQNKFNSHVVFYTCCLLVFK